MLTGRLAFTNTIKISNGEYNFTDEENETLSYQARKLVMRMLEPDPDERITCTQALNDDWF